MKTPRAALPPILVALLLLLAGPPAPGAADGPPEARLLRFPDIHGDFVVFVYGGDVWRAPSAGGAARRLTSHEGLELFPRISPDGRLVAYTAEYTGSRQVYVIPSEGGAPRQLTFYTDVGQLPPRGGYDYWILGWSPDGRILVRMNRLPWGERMGRYFLVDPAGGLEKPLELPHGGSASFSPDGRSLAYCPVDREFRTWKRTRGGRAQDIWIYDLADHRSRQITTFRGTDNFPMWSGDTIYFTSDQDGTLNLFSHDLKTGAMEQVTRYKEYDVLWPSLGPGAIVFMNGGYLHRLDLASGADERIPITIGSDLPARVPRFKDVSGNIGGADISPSGARAVFEARGDIFTVPAEHGATRNLTATQGTRERSPAWSPDGRWIAYLSDATGEYEIYVRAQDGTGEPRRLTRDGGPWKFGPIWSPDSERIAFGDQKRRLRIVDVESGKITDVDTGTRESITRCVWSPDGRWIAYVKSRPSMLPGIGVYSLDDGRAFMLGDGLTSDTEPVFGTDGRHLFFLSDRDYNLAFSSFEFNYIYNDAGKVYVAALDPEAPALFPPRSDEEKPADDAAGGKSSPAGETNGDAGAGAKDKSAPARTKEIQADGFVARTMSLPGLPPGNYGSLAVIPGAVFYTRSTAGSPDALYRYDLDKREESKVMDDVGGYTLSADGKKLLYRANRAWGIADAKADLKPGAGKLDLSGLSMKLDPVAEWEQMYQDAWRITRDWFYDPMMHGMDWKALGERYGKMVPFVAHRADLDFLFGELVGELDSGHTYVSPGDQPSVHRVRGGMLGCEFEDDGAGRYRISRIYRGENWDADYRSPLTEPGVDVKEGALLLAVDGEDLTTKDNPFRLLENKADKPVVLTVSGPGDRKSRDVTVVPIASELNLRYIDWVKSRIEMADKLSGGRVGYIHLPDTAGEGNRMLQKLFYGQVTRPALIIDDRYNGGGFIPDRMIEYLARRPLAWWERRDIGPLMTPGFAHAGPKAMLINGYASSGGDALPYFFRQNRLGPLIGTRTWGGLIGLSGNPSLADGGSVLVPTFRIYDQRGEWVVENEGVAPDIEVLDLPEEIRKGNDPSLAKAVSVLLEELAKNPPVTPKAPRPPDMKP